MPIERRRSEGGVRLRSVSSIRREGGGVFSKGPSKQSTDTGTRSSEV